MARTIKKRPIIGKTKDGFVIGVDLNPVKPPSKKELDRMRQRDIISRAYRKDKSLNTVI